MTSLRIAVPPLKYRVPAPYGARAISSSMASRSRSFSIVVAGTPSWRATRWISSLLCIDDVLRGDIHVKPHVARQDLVWGSGIEPCISRGRSDRDACSKPGRMPVEQLGKDKQPATHNVTVITKGCMRHGDRG